MSKLTIPGDFERAEKGYIIIAPLSEKTLGELHFIRETKIYVQDHEVVARFP
jgi:hypothetical protein